MKKFKLYENTNRKKLCLIIISCIVLAILAVSITILVIHSKNNKTSVKNTQSSSLSADEIKAEKLIKKEAQDPESSVNTPKVETGTAVDIPELLATTSVKELTNVSYGIDVSKYQGTIDWAKVKAAGIDFAMIRVGYRTQKTGIINADTNAKYNMQQATANGIKIGVYFFSTAITTNEAIEEANWVADYISKYKITYPVAFNCEGFTQSDNRQYSLSQSLRTDLALAFMKQIYDKGYTPMFYASKNELTNNSQWDTNRIDSTYKIWVSQYPAVPYPQKSTSDYTGTHAMWQYTNQGTIPGISTPVDVNIAYFGYDTEANSLNGEAPEIAAPDKEALLNFTAVNEIVTAKDSTNLRDIPSQDSTSKIMATLTNGMQATRVGISTSGWSKITYNGVTYYAVSSFLTTDLQPPAPVTPVTPADGSASGDGLTTVFSPVNELVTPKIEVNLRTLPSVTNENSKIIATISNGEKITRTGINNELGWSRVIYNGQTLYCVSSYLTLAN